MTLNKFEYGIEKMNEKMRRVFVYVELQKNDKIEKEEFEVILYKNDIDIAVIDARRYISPTLTNYDYLDAYMISYEDDLLRELKVCDVDVKDIDSVAEFMLLKKLIQARKYINDDEFKERVNEIIDSFLICYFF